jgi:hypothetical protein
MSGEANMLRKAYRASALIYLAALLVSLGARSAHLSLGITAGFGIAVLVFASWQLIVGQAIRPRRADFPAARADSPAEEAPPPARAGRRRALAIGLGLAKLPILLAAVYLLIGRELVSPLGFLGGFLIPQVALALLALGRLGAARARVARSAGGMGT